MTYICCSRYIRLGISFSTTISAEGMWVAPHDGDPRNRQRVMANTWNNPFFMFVLLQNSSVPSRFEVTQETVRYTGMLFFEVATSVLKSKGELVILWRHQLFAFKPRALSNQ